MGIAHSRDAQWAQSERSFRRAIEIDPSGSQSRLYFAANLLFPLGRLREAIEQIRVAERSDPLSPDVHYRLAFVLTSARRFEEAARYCEKLPDDFWAKPQCLGRIRTAQGRTHEAIEILEAALHSGGFKDTGVPGYLGYAYASAGRREDAEKLAASTSPVNAFHRALIFAGLGDKDRSFRALDAVAAGGPWSIGRALTFPELDLLRGDLRVLALRKKVGLPE